jgi:hypothetical protein
VLRAVSVKITVFWDVTPCCVVNGYQHFGRTCYLRHQGRRDEINELGSFIKRNFWTYNRSLLFWPCHSSGGYLQASHRGDPGWNPGQAMWNCGRQSGTGTGFLRVLRFPLPILIPPTAPDSLIILSSSLDTASLVK